MSGRTQFWLGATMLALAMGLLVGGLVVPPAAYSAGPEAESRAGRYALVTGVGGTVPRSETLYVVDDVNQLLFTLEYSSASKKILTRKISDIRRLTTKILEERANRDRRRD